MEISDCVIIRIGVKSQLDVYIKDSYKIYIHVDVLCLTNMSVLILNDRCGN
jgi:hypothetical protein